MTDKTTHLIPEAALLAFAADCLIRAGLDAGDAATVASSVVMADLRGTTFAWCDPLCHFW